MKRSPFMITVAVLVLLSFATDASAQKRGGTLRVAMNRTFDGFDTATHPTVFPTKLNAQRAIYEDLFGLDKNGKIIYNLGTSLKFSLNKKIFTVKLRKGVKFSNDEPFTARAFVGHFKRAMIFVWICRLHSMSALSRKPSAISFLVCRIIKLSRNFMFASSF
jgi:ABC-type transport system substrate-binding protein